MFEYQIREREGGKRSELTLAFEGKCKLRFDSCKCVDSREGDDLSLDLCLSLDELLRARIGSVRARGHSKRDVHFESLREPRWEVVESHRRVQQR